jgi:hypothetical protein
MSGSCLERYEVAQVWTVARLLDVLVGDVEFVEVDQHPTLSSEYALNTTTDGSCGLTFDMRGGRRIGPRSGTIT